MELTVVKDNGSKQRVDPKRKAMTYPEKADEWEDRLNKSLEANHKKMKSTEYKEEIKEPVWCHPRDRPLKKQDDIDFDPKWNYKANRAFRIGDKPALRSESDSYTSGSEASDERMDESEEKKEVVEDKSEKDAKAHAADFGTVTHDERHDGSLDKKDDEKKEKDQPQPPPLPPRPKAIAKEAPIPSKAKPQPKPPVVKAVPTAKAIKERTAEEIKFISDEMEEEQKRINNRAIEDARKAKDAKVKEQDDEIKRKETEARIRQFKDLKSDPKARPPPPQPDTRKNKLYYQSPWTKGKRSMRQNDGSYTYKATGDDVSQVAIRLKGLSKHAAPIEYTNLVKYYGENLIVMYILRDEKGCPTGSAVVQFADPEGPKGMVRNLNGYAVDKNQPSRVLTTEPSTIEYDVEKMDGLGNEATWQCCSYSTDAMMRPHGSKYMNYPWITGGYDPRKPRGTFYNESDPNDGDTCTLYAKST